MAGTDELNNWALENAQTVELDGDTLRFAPPEYVIVRKLQFFREGQSPKHLRDIRGMLEGLGDDWPRDELSKMMRRYGLEAEWQAVS